ncbi:MAG: hypothetical protein RJA49_2293 [Actinomycetota bacterium]
MIEWRPLSGRLGAEVAGPEGARRLIFLHGFAQTANSWKPIAEHFVDEGYQAVVIDLPGHAGSENVRADLRRAADMIAALGGPATYVGYSLGGRAALHVALMYPNIVKALAVIGANPGIDNEEERARRRDSDDDLIEHLEDIGVDAFLQEWVALPLFGGRAIGPLEMADRQRNTVEGLASSLRLAGTGAQGSLWPRLREMNMPVLAMAGANDEKYAAIAKQIANSVPRGKCVIVPGAAHSVHLEQPEAVMAAVDDLLARLQR